MNLGRSVSVMAHVQGEPSPWCISVRLSILSGTQTVDMVLEADVHGLKCHTQAMIGSREGLGAHTWPSELQDGSYPTTAQTGVEKGLEKERSFRWGCCPNTWCGLENCHTLESGGESLRNSRRESVGGDAYNLWEQSLRSTPRMANAAEICFDFFQENKWWKHDSGREDWFKV